MTNTHGAFYSTFTSAENRYTPEDRACIEQTVARLATVSTSAARPGMLLGKIQSGKTKTFLGIVALAFDNEFDIAIILTKGTKALARQTLARVRHDFAYFEQQDMVSIFDILTIPSGLTGYELRQKLIFVAKKQTDNLDRLRDLFQTTYPELSVKRILIIDDEADYASIGFKAPSGSLPEANATTRQIDDLRRLMQSSAFLQVTATPYSLYLQPDGLVVNGSEFRPVKPAFTELVPVHPDYIGSDFYFDHEPGEVSVGSLLYRPVGPNELLVLKQPDRRRFKVEECLSSPAVGTLRAAICNFLVGGAIRRLQERASGHDARKFSFLVHTEAGRSAHAWQEQVVSAIVTALKDAVVTAPERLDELLGAAYEDLRQSLSLLEQAIPPHDVVSAEVIRALAEDWVMISKVNSERQIEELLDDEGQLRLRTPLNIFIGGQILDRGVTLANLLGFYYGRRPQVFQQDTVLQHSRMFGFRPMADLAVTRFYTSPRIFDALRRMHESDAALRESIQSNPDSPVVFIQRDGGGAVIPCSPNKTLVSNTTTLRPFRRLLPVGFQVDFAVRAKPAVEAVDRLVNDSLPPGTSLDNPFRLPLETAIQVLDLIEPALLMDEDQGRYFDWEAARASLRYLASRAGDPTSVWCLVRTGRNVSRFVTAGGVKAFFDAPDTSHVEGRIARATCSDSPMLMLFRQNGDEARGWRSCPFYWPVIFAPASTPTVIYSDARAR